MRHGKKFNHLGRKAGHRKALMRNLAAALIEHKRINTTLAKAKALRKYIEPLVTKAKIASTHNMRVVFSYLQKKESVKELFGPIAAKVGDRPGGYVRIIKTGFRRTDGAEMAMIEFVDFNEVYNPNADDSDSKGGRRRRRRRRGGGGGGASTIATETAKQESVEEEESTEELVEDAEVEETIDETPVAEAEEESTEEVTEEEEAAEEQEQKEEDSEKKE